MEFDKYKHFSVEDFILDPYFKDQALRSMGEEATFFHTLETRFPEQREAIQEARKMVLRLDDHYRQQFPSAQEKMAVYQHILTRYDQMPNKTGFGLPVVRRLPLLRVMGPVAASLLLFVAVRWMLQSSAESGDQILRTAYGEIGDYQLPDGSVVSLNANSSLRLSPGWNEGEAREVWLEGEAFFEVVKKESGRAKFVVHTNGPDIEVLGTQFNVNTRSEKTLIMLEEGIIQLKQHNGEGAPQVVQERQLVEYNPGKAYTILSNVDPIKYRSWREGYIPVEDLTFAEIILKMEEVYGIQMTVPNEMLDKRPIEGAIPANNLEELLEIFKNLYDVTTEEENGTLRLYIR